MSADPDLPYRVGRKLGRTVYRQTGDGEELIGVMDTPELGALVVDALNAWAAATPAVAGAPEALSKDQKRIEEDR